jgi:HK97 family phage portal protein
LDYVVSTLRPWLVRWEQELERKLLAPRERERFQIEFNLEGLLRGDSESRARFLTTMVTHGIYTINEARRLERLAPVPGGDAPRVPLNTGPIGQSQDQE